MTITMECTCIYCGRTTDREHWPVCQDPGCVQEFETMLAQDPGAMVNWMNWAKRRMVEMGMRDGSRTQGTT